MSLLDFKITNWTKDVIEADFEASGKKCRNNKLQLNFKAKEYFLLATNTGEQCEILGRRMELEKPRISKLVDGGALIQAEFNAFRKTQFELLASEYRK